MPTGSIPGAAPSLRKVLSRKSENARIVYPGNVGYPTFWREILASHLAIRMTFAEELRNLCKQATSRESEEQAAEIAPRMQALIRKRMDELRGNLQALKRFDPRDASKKVA